MGTITVCPVWKKSNELFEKIYTNCTPSSTQSLTLYRTTLSAPVEAGLIYLGIKEGWANISDEWMQSPALVILKQVDEFLFCHLPKMERLATAYKSLKLLRVRFEDPPVANIVANVHSTTSIAVPRSSPESPNGCAPA